MIFYDILEPCSQATDSSLLSNKRCKSNDGVFYIVIVTSEHETMSIIEPDKILAKIGILMILL